MKKRSQSISNFSEPQVIAALAAQLERQGLSAIEITTEDGHLEITSSTIAQSPAAKSPTISTPDEPLARAPIAGLFLTAHPMRRDKAIEKGQKIGKGDIVAFIGIGPLLVPVTAQKAGIFNGFAASAETLVGYGDVLLKGRR